MYALGFYSGAHGYMEFEDDYMNIIQYIENDIPLEGYWLNHKYMLNYKDFTVDQQNFKELITMSANLLTQFGVETILQIDATLSAEDRGTNTWYQDALAEDALIRSTIKQTLGHKALMQKSFAGDVVFMDFFNPNAT